MVSTVANFVGTRCQQENGINRTESVEIGRGCAVENGATITQCFDNFTTVVLVTIAVTVGRDFHYQLGAL